MTSFVDRTQRAPAVRATPPRRRGLTSYTAMAREGACARAAGGVRSSRHAPSTTPTWQRREAGYAEPPNSCYVG